MTLQLPVVAQMLSPGEERALYLQDREAWQQYVVPRLTRILLSDDTVRANHAWEGMSENLRRLVWRRLNEAQKLHVRALRTESTTETAE